jgi:hypothetical protein
MELRGAFTSIVTWASDLEGFRRKADAIAATPDMYGADVEEFDAA